jgi:SAM-dependent methyltransferase
VSKVLDSVLATVFHLLCVERLERPGETYLQLPFEYLDRSFQQDYRNTTKLFPRLNYAIDLAGKSVVDVGCGLGPTCIYAASAGARRVVGVDIIQRNLDYAEDKIKRDFPSIASKVSFVCTEGNLQELGSQKFDVVVSHDAFEHYSDPERMATKLVGLLNDSGLLIITFGPPWKSPYGGHIDFMTKMPWAHLLFPERVIMAERRRLLPGENPQKFEDAIGGLNKMTVKRFRHIMKGQNIECLRFESNVSDHPAIRMMRAFSRIPPLEEYLTHSVYSVWRLKPGAPTDERT